MQLQNRVHIAETTQDWAALLQGAARALAAAETLDRQRTIFVVATAEQALACVVFGIHNNLDWGVIETRRLSPEVEARFAESGVTLVSAATGQRLGQVPQPADVVPGRICVLTSGTTGLLKLIPHSPETLNTFDRVSDLAPNSWFLPYQIGSYAWYQMVALGLFVPGQSLYLGDFNDLAASFEQALRAGRVTAISSTPTFWRHALMSVDETLLTSAPLASISLGGEIVDQAILDRLAQLYPQARIRHIYASSEAGAALVVSDGRAGFDAALLTRRDGLIHVKIENGRLFVRSPYGTRAADGDWIDTGDLVEERGGPGVFLRPGRQHHDQCRRPEGLSARHRRASDDAPECGLGPGHRPAGTAGGLSAGCQRCAAPADGPGRCGKHVDPALRGPSGRLRHPAGMGFS